MATKAGRRSVGRPLTVPPNMSPSKRKRRTEEERIAEMEAEIKRLKARAVEKKLKRDPALRHISGAIRAIDKASAASEDAATKEALAEARATLTACLSLNQGSPLKAVTIVPAARKRRPTADEVLAHLKANPGSRSEEICRALDTDAASLRAVLKELRSEGRVQVEGKARATRYQLA